MYTFKIYLVCRYHPHIWLWYENDLLSNYGSRSQAFCGGCHSLVHIYVYRALVGTKNVCGVFVRVDVFVLVFLSHFGHIITSRVESRRHEIRTRANPSIK